MGEEELISGEGWISDDSSFYGDEDEQEQLSNLCNNFNPKAFWSTRNRDLNFILSKNQAMPPPKLFNPGEGRFDHWQLGESPDDFVKRLPPLTTSRTSCCEWIWVRNPYPGSHRESAPDETAFIGNGSALLAQSLRARKDIQDGGKWKSKPTISRMLSEESKMLQDHITDLAVETRLLSGKWMLFPEMEDLTRTWRLVVDGVIRNRLGSTAKVAPDDGRPGPRVICIYTKDFRDKEDILRVLQELVSMGLAGTGRSIYYKSDPYTLLGIYKENAAEYGLQPSLYSSQKMLVEASREGCGRKQTQSTLNGFVESHGDPMDID